MKRMATNIKLLRFVSEEILAEIVEETATHVKVKNPVRIVIVPNKADPKNPSVGYAPYCEWTEDKEFTLSKNMLICISEPITVFVNQYNQQFGGIIVPDTKIIT
jgi:hypothetical protein